MAVTNPSDVTSSIPAKYAARVMRNAVKKTFWDRMTTPEGGGGAVIEKDEVLNKPGETITIQVTNPLVGAGVEGDTTALVGSEEKLSTSAITVSTVYFRHGVRVNNRAQKKSMVDLRNEGSTRLSEWAKVKLDTLRFGSALNKGFYYTAAGTAGTEASGGTPYVRWVAGRTSNATLTAPDKMTLAELSKTKAVMLDRGCIPWEVNGKFYLVAVLDQWQIFDIKTSDSTWAQAMREAQVDNGDNPLFHGNVGQWDGIIIKEAARVLSAADGATALRTATGLVFGPEAFIQGYGSYPDWAEDTFDYGLEFGIAWGMDYGCRRAFETQSSQLRSIAVKAT